VAFIVITSSYGLADVSFKYDPDIIAMVKAIPSKAYVPEGKYWTIWATHVPTLANLLTSKGHTVSVNGEHWIRQGPKTGPFDTGTRQASGNPFKDFMASIPEQYRGKAYQALARVFHPDTGGDVTLMQKLNEAKP
jgi:hypothetical protein